MTPSWICFFPLLPLCLGIIDGDPPESLATKALVFIDNGVAASRTERYCTGSLISRWHVITIGNCCASSSLSSRIRVGSRWAFQEGETYGIRNYKIIRGNSVNNYDDNYWQLCVIKMNRPVSKNVQIAILTLPQGKVPKLPEKLTAYGFGTAREDLYDPNNSLMSLQMPEADHNACTTAYQYPLRENPRDIFTFLCRGYTDKKKKLTRFDSGGPLVEDPLNKLWGVAVISQDLNMPLTNNYPTFAINVADLRPEIADALKALDESI